MFRLQLPGNNVISINPALDHAGVAFFLPRHVKRGAEFTETNKASSDSEDGQSRPCIANAANNCYLLLVHGSKYLLLNNNGT